MKSFQFAVLFIIAAAAFCQAQSASPAAAPDYASALTIGIEGIEELAEAFNEVGAPAAAPLQMDLEMALAPYNIDARAPAPEIDAAVMNLSPTQQNDLGNNLAEILEDDLDYDYESVIEIDLPPASSPNSADYGDLYDFLGSIFGGRKMKL